MNRRGFTLVEVLIGLVILAIGLLAIAALQITSVKVNASSATVTRATLLAKSQLEYLRDLPYSHASLGSGSHNPTGVTVPASFSMGYQVAEDAVASTKTIQVTVSWTDKGVHSISLKALRFNL